MSRQYGMSVRVSGFRPEAADAIYKAARGQWSFAEQWPCDKSQQTRPVQHMYGEDQLAGGETEQQLAERLAVAIWRANEAYCEVTVTVTWVKEVPPYEQRRLNKDDYARLLGSIRRKQMTKSRKSTKNSRGGSRPVTPTKQRRFGLDEQVETWRGKTIYGRRGSNYARVAGTVTGSVRRCSLDGCRGIRVMVKWPDGHRTWPCSEGIVAEGEDLRIL